MWINHGTECINLDNIVSINIYGHAIYFYTINEKAFGDSALVWKFKTPEEAEEIYYKLKKRILWSDDIYEI